MGWLWKIFDGCFSLTARLRARTLLAVALLHLSLIDSFCWSLSRLSLSHDQLLMAWQTLTACHFIKQCAWSMPARIMEGEDQLPHV